MTRHRLLGAALAISLCFTPLMALAERVALVIGMGAYAHVPPLENTLNDAADVAEKLAQIGFNVTVAMDKPQEELLDIMDGFAFRSETADLALIYFAGHGVEVQGQNYLIPVDAEVRSNQDVQRLSVSLDQFLQVVDKARKMRIVILDSCRDSPFGDVIDTTQDPSYAVAGDTATRSTAGQGLAPVDPERGTLVAFAARDGQVALDGADGNSPYARALMNSMAEPGLEISLMFRKVRDDVLAATGNLQEPFTYGSLSGTPFYLAGAEEGQADVVAVADPREAWASLRPEQEQQLRALADSGDTRSMLGLAYIRLNPKEGRYNLAEAVDYLERAAKAGAPDAQFELAKLYEQGLGVPADPARALALYQSSAAQDFADAINDLGFLYYQGGLGLAPDPARALDHFRRAADLRHPEALFNYAALIDDGAVAGLGPPEAGDYLYRALRSGSQPVLQQLSTNANQFSPATRKELQQKLAQNGFYQGKPDGAFGKGTQKAIDMAFGLEIPQN